MSLVASQSNRADVLTCVPQGCLYESFCLAASYKQGGQGVSSEEIREFWFWKKSRIHSLHHFDVDRTLFFVKQRCPESGIRAVLQKYRESGSIMYQMQKAQVNGHAENCKQQHLDKAGLRRHSFWWRNFFDCDWQRTKSFLSVEVDGVLRHDVRTVPDREDFDVTLPMEYPVEMVPWRPRLSRRFDNFVVDLSDPEIMGECDLWLFSLLLCVSFLDLQLSVVCLLSLDRWCPAHFLSYFHSSGWWVAWGVFK